MKVSVFYSFFLSLLFFVLYTNCSDDIAAPQAESPKKGIKIEEKWYQPGDMMDTLLYGFKAEYDINGHPLDKKSFSRSDGELHLHSTFKYNDHGDAIEEINTQVKENRINKILYKYEYDPAGRKLNMVKKDGEGNIISEHEFSYQKDGSYDESIKVNGKDESVRKVDKNGNLLQLERFINKSILTNEWDEHGTLLKKLMTVNDKVVQDSDYLNVYDENGRLTSTEMGYRKREYEYNENGDIVKETRYKSNSIDRVIHFKYTYYE